MRACKFAWTTERMSDWLSSYCFDLLQARKEFEGYYKKVHKGAVVLSLSPRHISDQCETEVGRR